MIYVMRTGVPWRDLPEQFGKWGTVHQRFRRWTVAGVFDRLCEATQGLFDFHVVMVDGSFVKVHQHATGARRNGSSPDDSARRQGIGRSRGGLNSKVMALVDRNGRLMKFAVVPGNVAENLQLPALLNGITTGEVIADKAYDSNAIRQMLAGQNVIATIPSKSNRTIPIWHDPDHYATRHLVENWFCDAKQWRGIATRYAKLLDNFVANLCLSAWYLSTKANGRATKTPEYKKIMVYCQGQGRCSWLR